MCSMQTVRHTKERLGWKYSTLQFWRGQIKIVSVGV